MTRVVLVASGIVKRYGGVTALDGVGITLARGEIHAVVGENGAGKSTLVKTICGVVAPDAGTVELDGDPLDVADVRAAAARGIAVVSQELTTFGDLTVLENLFPHDAPRHAGLLDRRAMRRLAAPVLDELGLRVSPATRVGALPLADQQLLEICRALLQRPRVLVLDEPTSALPADATARLQETARRLADRGLAVLYVSHFLEEVVRIADRVSVLRDGRIVLSGADVTEVSVGSLVSAMLGAPQPERRPARVRTATGATAVELRDVTVPGRLRGVSLDVAAGEILGLAGLQGSGHLAVLDAVCGRLRPSAGTVTLPGGVVPRSLRHAVRSGVAYVTGDRKVRGLMLDKRLWENATAVRSLALGRDGVWVYGRRLVARADALVARLRITGDARTPTRALSGGNQQKVVLAKWLDAEPRVVVLDDPTRGVDVGARAEVHGLVTGLAAEGTSVLVASTDLTELVDLCDRVLVLRRGEVVTELGAAELSEQVLSLAMNAAAGS